MSEFLTALDSSLKKLGLDIAQDKCEMMEEYCAQLIEYNKHVNLTAVTEPAQAAVKHFADSLAILAYTQIPQGASLLDVGTGAGFPGMALLLARPDLQLTLMDSTDKKLEFIRTQCQRLAIAPQVLHLRAEEGAKGTLREGFDFVTARAVAQLRVLAEYCLPFVKKGGYFIAMKGASPDDELEEAANAISVTGGQQQRVERFELGDSGARSLIYIKKISQTPPQYPRASTRISKNPL